MALLLIDPLQLEELQKKKEKSSAKIAVFLSAKFFCQFFPPTKKKMGKDPMRLEFVYDVVGAVWRRGTRASRKGSGYYDNKQNIVVARHERALRTGKAKLGQSSKQHRRTGIVLQVIEFGLPHLFPTSSSLSPCHGFAFVDFFVMASHPQKSRPVLPTLEPILVAKSSGRIERVTTAEFGNLISAEYKCFLLSKTAKIRRG